MVLASRFKKVIATDISENQIANADKRPNIFYAPSQAEKTEIEDNSINLVTVAQAAHWFDLPKFYDEVLRVCKPDGMIAIWAYPKSYFVDLKLDAVFSDFFEMLWEKECWPWERRYVDDGYQDLLFPFDEMPTPSLELKHEHNLESFLNYVQTWSSVLEYERKFGSNPVTNILEPKIAALWKHPVEVKQLKSPITCKIGPVK